MRRRIATALVAAGTGLLPLVLTAPPASAAGPARPYDFNGDGYPELAVGAPGLQVNGRTQSGGVVVLPASRNGLSLQERILSQSTRGVAGGSEEGDFFGSAVVSADFDRDGYADLAVGQPGEALGDANDAGAVTVLYGSARGLTGARSAQLSEPSGRSEFARFGEALVAADLNGDGYADLAVGAPREDRDGAPTEDFPASGTVTVLSGGGRGLTRSGARQLRGQGGSADWDHQFGGALAAGDVDGDGATDLLVGSVGDGYLDGEGYPGSLSYCRGGAAGPAGCSRLVHGDRYAGISDLAVGNTSGTDRPEVVVGVPSPDDDRDDPGHVVVLTLDGNGPGTVAREQQLTQGSDGVPGSDEAGDEFGGSVAVADIDRDGYADLAVGAPGEAGDGQGQSGRLTIIHGASSGWRTSGNYSYTQNTPDIPGAAEYPDRFGGSVTLLDHDRDGRLDLTVGAPGENSGSGAITTLRGSGTRFTTSGSRTFGLATLGYAHPGGARFGEDLGR
jgi:hypothetical protein